jgi:Tol biopolymer transport system component
MSASDLDRRLAGFFDAASSQALPEGLLDDVYSVTRAMPQRKGLAARRTAGVFAWWTNPFGTAPQLRVLVLAVLLLIVLAATVVYVGSHYRRLPPPYGPAENGRLVFDLDRRLYVLDAVDPARTPVPLDIGLGRSWAPTFSPDGTQLAFFSQVADGAPIELFVANADGMGARSISGDVPPTGGFGIAWSPDSRHIVYDSTANGRHSAIYVAATDGSGVRQISPDDEVDRTGPVWSHVSAMWSRSGELIAYRKDPASHDHIELAVTTPDGRDERVLQRAQVSDGGFRGLQWSPDGTEVAYFRMEGSTDVLETVNLYTSVWPISEEDAFNPVWSNDGHSLAYALRSTETVILEVPAGTQTRLPAGLADCGAYFSPDDRWMVGLGTDCRKVLLFPADDPTAVTRISGADGEVMGVGIQRLAP